MVSIAATFCVFAKKPASPHRVSSAKKPAAVSCVFAKRPVRGGVSAKHVLSNERLLPTFLSAYEKAFNVITYMGLPLGFAVTSVAHTVQDLLPIGKLTPTSLFFDVEKMIFKIVFSNEIVVFFSIDIFGKVQISQECDLSCHGVFADARLSVVQIW